MSAIVKKCKKHGDLTSEEVYKEKNQSIKGYLLRCNLCKLDKDRRWKRLHREQHIQASLRWKKNNREHVNEWQRKDRAKDPGKYREYTERTRNTKNKRLKRTTNDIINFFNITIEDYEKIFLEHGNVCSICKQVETRKSRTEGNICRLAIDHCHICEEKGIDGMPAIRGLLCHSCNTALGKFKDDIELMKKAIQYLEQHQHS